MRLLGTKKNKSRLR